MPNSFENPFIPKPDNLKPDSAEFLQKFAKASDEQLKKAAITHMEVAQPEASIPQQGSLKESVTQEEREAYFDELIEINGVNVKRRDVLALQTLVDHLNEQPLSTNEVPCELGKGGLTVGSEAGRVNPILVSGDGNVVEMSLPDTEFLTDLRKITFPDKLFSLELYNSRVGTLAGVKFPASLSYLALVSHEAMTLDGAGFPEKLKYLSVASPGLDTLKGVKFPSALETLDVSNSPLTDLRGVELPSNLKKLFMQELPQGLDLQGARLPDGLEDLLMDGTSIINADLVHWPRELIQLNLGVVGSLKGVVFPESLSILDLTEVEKGALKDLVLPKSVRTLTISEGSGDAAADLQSRFPSLDILWR